MESVQRISDELNESDLLGLLAGLRKTQHMWLGIPAW